MSVIICDWFLDQHDLHRHVYTLKYTMPFSKDETKICYKYFFEFLKPIFISMFIGNQCNLYLLNIYHQKQKYCTWWHVSPFYNSEKNAKSFIVIDAFQTIHSPLFLTKYFINNLLMVLQTFLFLFSFLIELHCESTKYSKLTYRI